MKTSSLHISAIFCILSLAACGGISTDPTYENKSRDKLYKHGSLVSEDGGWNIFGGKEKKTADTVGIGVNGFLWRASLDTISFMPIASADPFGGVILTEWFSAPETPNERTKLNVIIRDRELTANGVKVTVFRQTKTAKSDWRDAAVAPSTATAIEDAILTRARQIRMAQKQFN